MVKDFDKWNELKKRINGEGARLYKTREIWWCRIGLNVGSEEDGKGKNMLRPVLVMRGFSKTICLVVPFTTVYRHDPYRLPVGQIQGRISYANISQLRIIDSRRLVTRMGFLKKKEFSVVKKALKDLL